MPSYLVTGASRGLGFTFIDILSQDPKNTVIGLVRDVASTVQKISAELPGREGNKNLHIVQGDLVDYESLKRSVDVVSSILGNDGGLDYIIANGAIISKWSQYNGIGELAQKSPRELEQDMLTSFQTNVIGNVHLFALYLPFTLRTTTKKIITISTGFADLDLTRKYNLEASAPYAVSKAAMNAVAAKFHAQYSEQGVLFLNICPGVVDTGVYEGATEEQMKAIMKQAEKFQAYADDFKGAISPEESVTKILQVVEKASLEDGYGGEFISHRGKGMKWL
ncbi:NAD(P)-binding protein [Poronia punctata]|nr:NAD(P)-binding protein [Poronia punctata]